MNNIINNYTKGVHMGMQPIRVLEENILKILESEFPEFEELRKLTEELGLKKGIIYHSNEFPVFYTDQDGDCIAQLPYVSFDKEINIHETFLSYLWIISYGLFVTYVEYDPKINKTKDDVLNSDYVKNANKLMEYGVSLLNNFTKWDYALPNPEQVSKDDPKLADYIGRTNGLHLYALLFILFHELSHVKLKHIDYGEEFYKKWYSMPPNDEVKKMEYEADESAFSLINKATTVENKTSMKFGCVIAMCSLLILSKNYKSNTHTDTHERIYTALDKLSLNDDDAVWHIASMSVILWSLVYKIPLNFNLKYTKPKELFVELYKQLEKL
jgi:hypothetical protein